MKRPPAGTSTPMEIPKRIRDRMDEVPGDLLAPNTKRAYGSAWRAFERWCSAKSVLPVPASPETVAWYLLDRAESPTPKGEMAYAKATVLIWVAAINKVHEAAGLEPPGKSPRVRQTVKSIMRRNNRSAKRAAPATANVLRDSVAALALYDPEGGAVAHRDAAVLLTGMVGAFRRSELAALRIEDVLKRLDGSLQVVVRRSKTDQYGNGISKALPIAADPLMCAPCALVRWVRLYERMRADPSVLSNLSNTQVATAHICSATRPHHGFISDTLPRDAPLFAALGNGKSIQNHNMTPTHLGAIIKKRLAAAGYDNDAYSGHSLRAGFVTQAYRQGASTHEIMRQTGHRNPVTVEVYAREVDPLLHNAASKLGL